MFKIFRLGLVLVIFATVFCSASLSFAAAVGSAGGAALPSPTVRNALTNENGNETGSPVRIRFIPAAITQTKTVELASGGALTKAPDGVFEIPINEEGLFRIKFNSPNPETVVDTVRDSMTLENGTGVPWDFVEITKATYMGQPVDLALIKNADGSLKNSFQVNVVSGISDMQIYFKYKTQTATPAQ